MVVENKIIHVR